MTTYLGKSCSFGLPRVPFVNCRQFMYLVISLLVLRAECGNWLYQWSLLILLLVIKISINKKIGVCIRYKNKQIQIQKFLLIKRTTFSFGHSLTAIHILLLQRKNSLNKCGMFLVFTHSSQHRIQAWRGHLIGVKYLPGPLSLKINFTRVMKCSNHWWT